MPTQIADMVGSADFPGSASRFLSAGESTCEPGDSFAQGSSIATGRRDRVAPARRLIDDQQLV
jgi:hypothetical protein